MGYIENLQKAKAYDDIKERQILEDRNRANQQRIAESQAAKDFDDQKLQAARLEGLAAVMGNTTSNNTAPPTDNGITREELVVLAQMGVKNPTMEDVLNLRSQITNANPQQVAATEAPRQLLSRPTDSGLAASTIGR